MPRFIVERKPYLIKTPKTLAFYAFLVKAAWATLTIKISINRVAIITANLV